MGYVETDLAYFAGLFDGEGHISLGMHPHPRYKSIEMHSINFCIGNTDITLLKWVVNIFGGRITTQINNCDSPSHYKQQYMWQAHSNTLQDYLPLLVPYLKSKKRQAKLLLEYLKYKKNYRRNGAPPEYKEWRKSIRNQITELNHFKKI